MSVIDGSIISYGIGQRECVDDIIRYTESDDCHEMIVVYRDGTTRKQGKNGLILRVYQDALLRVQGQRHERDWRTVHAAESQARGVHRMASALEAMGSEMELTRCGSRYPRLF